MSKNIETVQQALISIIIINKVSTFTIATDNTNKSTFLTHTTRESVKNSNNNNANNIQLTKPSR